MTNRVWGHPNFDKSGRWLDKAYVWKKNQPDPLIIRAVLSGFYCGSRFVPVCFSFTKTKPQASLREELIEDCVLGWLSET